jgi:hypothetical protein
LKKVARALLAEPTLVLKVAPVRLVWEALVVLEVVVPIPVLEVVVPIPVLEVVLTPVLPLKPLLKV